MNRLRHLFQFLYSIYALLSFILVMLLIFPFVLIAIAFGKIKGGNIIYKLCSIWGRVWYQTIGLKHTEIYEAPHNRNQQYIFVANHISYMDIPAVVLAIHQPFRALGKYEMVKVLIFGQIYKAAVILVNRKDAQTRAKSVRALKAAIKNNISIIIFPEGTFNETNQPLKSFYDGAFRIAIETQTPIKPLLLVDTLKRLHYSSSFSLTSGSNRVVYLAEVPVSGLTFKDIPLLKKQVYTLMEDALKRYIVYPTP
ncbi:MAG: 1-acyl-sn-glycerol-3-phosphate acyltransferase [Sphingobacteriia bacterium]|nr:MAG: 1-acyl-sn-glycerol-3-phosphate acyltransferase [Sphingobacteriia bacterium]